MFIGMWRQRKKVFIFLCLVFFMFVALTIRLVKVMIIDADKYTQQVEELHERERDIKAPRGLITDRKGNILADNKTVCTISVIHSQIKDEDKVVSVLTKELGISEEKVRKLVSKVSVREKIKSNVDKEIGDRIREYNLDGVKIDEDYKRYYPYDTLLSKVIGFTGGDNQGIIGLETKYEKYLAGENGKILTLTDAKGIELEGEAEKRKEAIQGNTLVTSIDLDMQKYAYQAAKKVYESKKANYVSIIIMNPNNGEIYTMVNVPEYDLNNPYELIKRDEENNLFTEMTTDMKELNKMWRNQCINDTYEPGSTFKIVTATAGLEEGVVTKDSTFSCPGYKIVEDRRIKCHKVNGHGAEDFVHATMNSCNPVFIEVGLRLGVNNYYKYMKKLGLMEKTGVDLPGEAGTIIHKIEDVGQVELATMSFGQSFQITPLQLLRAVCAVINGGKLITPHFGIEIKDLEGNVVEKLKYNEKCGVVSKSTCETMKYILEKVVSEGGGIKAKIEGYSIGGKTATSQKLPRNSGKYIGSFIGFYPADNPEIIAMCIIDEPVGVYYGGTIAAPVIKEIYENILPGIDYLNK